MYAYMHSYNTEQFYQAELLQTILTNHLRQKLNFLSETLPVVSRPMIALQIKIKLKYIIS